MARIYAGILGPLAFLTVLAHGTIHAWRIDTILLTAWWSLLLFAAMGGVAGWMGGRIVEDSVETALSGELARQQPPANPEPPAPAP